MTPRELVRCWVDAFNAQDLETLAGFYAEDAVNHQVAESPVVGREAIRRMFAEEFAAARMVCIVENLFEEGEWAILEWRDPLGLRGCGFFHVVGGRIAFQRGYWDKLSFLRAHGLPLPDQS
jgi:limonene-1,2-epoxide hydrolase